MTDTQRALRNIRRLLARKAELEARIAALRYAKAGIDPDEEKESLNWRDNPELINNIYG